MEINPRGKINLSLYITGRLPDGYHSVDTLYWPLALYDHLKIEPAAELRLETASRELAGEDNLLIKAWRLLHEQYDIPPLHMVLEKQIPWEAGLGGGSGDAAALLLACNKLFKLGLSRRRLCKIGEALGADVPAAIYGLPVRGRGTGTQLEAFSLSLDLPLLIIKPPQGFSTAAMYRAWDFRAGQKLPVPDAEIIEAAQEKLIRALAGDSVRALLPWLHNDFETLLEGEARDVFEKARGLLLDSGAWAAHLCGSGSAVFGLYGGEEQRQEARAGLKKIMPAGWQLLSPLLRSGEHARADQ